MISITQPFVIQRSFESDEEISLKKLSHSESFSRRVTCDRNASNISRSNSAYISYCSVILYTIVRFFPSGSDLSLGIM